MSDKSADYVAARMAEIHQGQQGFWASRSREPFSAMAFLALPVVPDLKLTDRGLVDVKRFEFVDLFV
jgi:adenine deaminase